MPFTYRMQYDVSVVGLKQIAFANTSGLLDIGAELELLVKELHMIVYNLHLQLMFVVLNVQLMASIMLASARQLVIMYNNILELVSKYHMFV
jgi:hypothetical protein